MYVKAGSGIEFEIVWMDKIRSINGDMLIVDASRGIELLGVDNGSAHDEHGHLQPTEPQRESKLGGHYQGPGARGGDPHVWLSPANAEKMIGNICDGLIELDPANEEYYTGNRDAYQKRLADLDRYIREKLAGVPGHRFLVYHPAWGYFAHQYGVEQIAVEHGGKEPTAREMVRIVGDAKELGIKAILVEPQSSTVGAEVIAEEIGGFVMFADPLARDYIHNMGKVADELAEVLR
jgi:zinc transport system substrate-binding protein